MDILAERGLAILFISHELAVVASLCDEIFVMRAGRIFEAGPGREVRTRQRHDYTREIIAVSER